jgi:hypothetical protein
MRSAPCLHHLCKREVPLAPSTPPRIRAVCAHVMPDGRPCPESPRIYDEETIAVVDGELAFWAPELRFDGDQALASAPSSQASAKAPPGPVRPPDVGATIVSTDKNGNFVIQAVSGAPPGYSAGVSAPSVQNSPAPEPAQTLPERAKRATSAEEADIDDWEP